MSADVVRGPKTPFWSCQSCQATSNWACRLRCRCGAKAPGYVLARAKNFGNDGDDHGTDGRVRRMPGAGTRREAKVEQQLAALQKKLDSFISKGGGQPQVSGGSKSNGSAGPTDGNQVQGGAKADVEGDQAQVKELEQAIRGCSGELCADARATLQAKLKEVRLRIESKKSPLTQHTNVGHRLAKATGKLEKLHEDIAEQDKLLEDIRERKDELEEQKKAAETEVAELQKQLYLSRAAAVPPQPEGMADDLAPEALEGKDEIKKMFESAAFKEYQKLRKEQFVAKGGSAPPTGNAEQVPVPGGEDDMDLAFADVQAAEDFWDKHKGDKRAIVEALSAAPLKKPKKSSL